MFDSAVAEPCPGSGDRLPTDDLVGLDGLDREPWWLLDEPEDPHGWVPDALDELMAALPLPDWPVDEPVVAYGSCEPSGWLALDLDTATTDPRRLDDATLVEAIIGFDRLTSWAQARQARLLDELAARRPTDTAPYTARWASVASEYAPDEVGVALHLSRGAACARIGLARRLLATLPDTHRLWESGRIDTFKARAIDDATVVLPDELARAVQARVLPNAPQQTLAELKAALAKAVITVDPDGAEARHHTARRDRRVVLTPEADGMASLWAMLTATQAVGAFTWLTRLARGLGTDDPRSMDTRRADILAALLSGHLVVNPDTNPAGTAGTDPADDRGPTNHDADDTATDTATDATATRGPASGTTPATTSAGRPIQPATPGKPLIHVVIAHSTLTGADDQPADLAGYGPIPASLARDTAADGVWRRLVTDPLSATLLDHGRTTYHPPAGLADHVRARDLHCRFPGCRKQAADAELDHVIAWSDGGTTSKDNLAGYCTHHHLLKTHAPGWKVRAHPDGTLTWTTPTGHRHTTRPHDYGPEPPGPPPPPEPAPPAAPYDPAHDPPPF